MDLRTEFRQLLRDAVARQFDGGKSGCFLSGGTDSSTVAGMIGEVSGQPPATYSIGFEAEGYDEMEYARIAARHFKTEHHEYYVTPDDLVRSIPSVAQYYDQPFGNSSALPAYYCAKMAKEDGVSKILAGDGGDELFGGNTRYAKQKVFGYYDSVPGLFRNALLEPLLLKTPLGKLPLARKGASYIEQAEFRCPIAARYTTCFIGWASGRFSTRIFLPEWISMTPSGSSEGSGIWPLRNRRRIANWHSTGVTRWRNAIFRKWSERRPGWDQGRIPFARHRSGEFLDATSHELQGERLEVALVLQGGIARIPARRNSCQEKAGFWPAVRRLGCQEPKIEEPRRGLCPWSG